jgi:hypothetical protein
MSKVFRIVGLLRRGRARPDCRGRNDGDHAGYAGGSNVLDCPDSAERAAPLLFRLAATRNWPDERVDVTTVI